MTITVGDTFGPYSFGPVDPEAMRVWAGVLADDNPIHLDPAAVRAMGLGDKRINQGPANLAYAINALMTAFPGGRIARLTNRFTANVLEDDMLGTTVTVTGIEGGLIRCSFAVEVAGSGPAVTGTAEVVAPRS